MDSGRIKSILEAEIQNAIGWLQSETTTERTRAMNYYLRYPYGNEVEGRSKIVTGEVAEAIDGALPQLMRVFTSTDDIVEFEPVTEDDIQKAKQATEYCNYVFYKDNDGLLILHNWMKDALLQKVGIVKCYWESEEEVEKETFKDLTEDELAMLLADGEWEVKAHDSYPDPAVQLPEGVTAEQAMQMGAPIPMLHTVKVKKTKKTGKVCIENVPPEEFLISKGAKSICDDTFKAHRRLLTRSELIEMGYSRDVVDDLAAYDDLTFNAERVARFPQGEQPRMQPQMDFSQQLIEIYECYCHIDENDDGHAELRRIVLSANEILSDEECDYIPFHALCPIPVPHKFFGQSLADRVMDVQLIKSTITRQMLDNLYLTNNTRVGAVEGQVNLDDLQNSTPGGIVRLKNPNAVVPMAVQSNIQQAFPMLEYFDGIQAKRTGVSDAQQGLNPDILSNVTATAIAAMTQASTGKLELIARIFAETGIKSLFKAILALLIKYQDKPRVVRIRGQFTPFDPREWKADYDVSIHVGLGTGSHEQQLAMLQMILQKQEQIFMQYGAANPLVAVSQYRETLAKMIEAAGFKSADAFFKTITPEQDAQLAQPQQQQPDPNLQSAQIIAQIEREKTQAKAQIEAAKLDLERQQLEAEFTRKGIELAQKADKERLELRIKEAEVAVKQMQAILAMDIADEDMRNKQADMVLKAIREIGNLMPQGAM